MDFKYIMFILLMIINYVAGDLLQVSSAPINMTRVLRSITGITITGCYMECARENGCKSIAITEGDPNQLPTCYLLKEDNGHYEGGENVMTTVQEIGSGPTVHGQWGCWANSSTCNASCGGGHINQTRKCDSPKPKHGGDNCTGLDHRTIRCNSHPCPVNGEWGLWQNETTCNASCGGGYLNQTRKCNSPEPQHDGDDCVGKGNRTIDCNTQPCPVHGQWGCWANSSTCNASCGGGHINQTRKCDSPKPKHGGDNCTGLDHRTIRCNSHPCPVNGEWGSWQNETTCNAPCGGGYLNQTRKCDSPEPKHGGDDCVGKGERTIVCNTQGCPVHGSWGAWKVTSFCDDQCNGGTFTKERQCDSPKPEHGGNDCNGDKVISLPCSTKACPVVNIALRKPATQLGLYASLTQYRASKGNDGSEHTCSMTSRKSSPWWQVDLQADVEIEYFILRESGGNKDDVKVLGKTANGLFQTCKDHVNIKARVVRFTCDSNQKFRYVRIEGKRYGSVTIDEFEVYVKKS